MIAFDHRGYGRSKEIPEGPDRSQYTQNLLELLDHLGIQKASFVAQSMGGTCCIGLTAWHPERVQALVMACTTGSIYEAGLDSIAEEMRKTAEQLPKSERVLSPGFRQRRPDLTDLFLQIHSFNIADRHVVRGKEYKGPTPEEVVSSKVPVLFITGLEDAVVAPDMLRRAHKLVTGSSLAEVPGRRPLRILGAPRPLQLPGAQLPGEARSLAHWPPVVAGVRLELGNSLRQPECSIANATAATGSGHRY